MTLADAIKLEEAACEALWAATAMAQQIGALDPRCSLLRSSESDRLLAQARAIRRELGEEVGQFADPAPQSVAFPVAFVSTATETREAKLRAIADGIGAEQSDLTIAIRTGMSPAAFALQESDKAIARRESLRAQIELDAVVQSIVDCMP